jgi:hypothetical protein
MTAPAEPRILAEVGGLAVAEQGPLIVVMDRGTGALATVAFVLGVLALVPGGFGAVTLAPTAPWWRRWTRSGSSAARSSRRALRCWLR